MPMRTPFGISGFPARAISLNGGRSSGNPVFLARNEFYLGYTRDRAPSIVFTDVKDRHAKAALGGV